MKLLGMTVFALACLAQTVVPEPEMADIFYRLDQGNLIPLERQSPTTRSNAHGFLVMNMTTVSEFPGAKSPVRFKSGERLDFVVRTIVPVFAVDPNTIYCLRKLDPKKSTRELPIMSARFSPLGTSTTSTPAEGILPVEFARYGNSSLKITTGVLAPGEYSVGHVHGQAVFCFGVD
jgi:hypothetical protein